MELLRRRRRTRNQRNRRDTFAKGVEGLREVSRRISKGYADDKPSDPMAVNRLEGKHVGIELATGPADQLISGVALIQDNPDDLVQKKTLTIYDDMKKDSMIKAALFVKKFSRLSTQWIVRPASDDQKDIDIANFYEKQLEDMPGTIVRMLLGMMTALDYGYSIMEKNYYYIREGADKGKTGLSSIKSRKPHDFRFQQDLHSNIEGLYQQQTTGEERLPVNKFIISTWMPEFENPYGISDLRAAYVPWWQKDVILRFQAIFLERFAAPILLGKYPPGTTQTDIETLLEILEDIQIHTVATMQEDMNIDTVKMDRSGSDLYTKAIDKRDMMIGQAILIPQLLGFSERGSTGSYALGKKQFDLFIGILWHLGRMLEEVIHEQLTIPYISWNFDVDEYPEFIFQPLAEESAEVKSKILATLTGSGFIDPSDPEIQEWGAEYLNILPKTQSKASFMAQEALSFVEPFKFYSPDGRDHYEIEILETDARIELLEDALAKT